MQKSLTIRPSVIVSRINEILLKYNYLLSPWNLIRNRLQFKIWKLAGLEKQSGKYSSILYHGNPIHSNYLGELIFGDTYQKEFIGNVWIWKFIAILMNGTRSHSFLVLETRKFLMNFMPQNKMLFLPDWVGAEIDLQGSLNSTIKRSSNLKFFANKIKKNHYKYRVSISDEDFHLFYNKMYLPFIKNRHQNKAFIKSIDEMKETFRSGELLIIDKKEKPLAGVLISFNQPRNVPRMTQLGVSDGNYEYVKEGVIGALYYFTIEYLKSINYSAVNLGWSRPFLNDGLLNFKKRFGCQFDLDSERMFAFYPNALNQITKAFLIGNPFVSIKGNRLVGNVFIDSSDNSKSVDGDKLKSRYHFSGIDDVIIYDLRDDVSMNKKHRTLKKQIV